MTHPVTDTKYGQIFLPDSENDLIRRILELHGEWAYLEVLILSSLLSNNDVVYDLGAYIGTFSLGIAGVANLKKILAVEPSCSSGKLLAKNLKNNCKAPFQTKNCAVGFEPGLALEHIHTNNNLGSRTYETISDYAVSNTKEIVEQCTLKKLRELHGDYDIIKLDIEGAEYDALRSDAAWIKETKPIVWAECNESPAVRELLQFYLWAELSPVYIAYPVFRHDNFKKSNHLPFPIAYEAALLGGANEKLAKLTTKHLMEEIYCVQIDSYESLRKAMWLTPRWGREEWTCLSKSELIALLGRVTREECYEKFLPHAIKIA
ncbi:MAG: FkbM family methyltransferase [Methylococcaceae bacterium]|nr:FkbM family methyltransferase [Methylococcaceae bacterium]